MEIREKSVREGLRIAPRRIANKALLQKLWQITFCHEKMSQPLQVSHFSFFAFNLFKSLRIDVYSLEQLKKKVPANPDLNLIARETKCNFQIFWKKNSNTGRV